MPIAILISGRGSNMRVIAEQAAKGALMTDVRVVLSDQPTAAGLGIARAMNIPTEVLEPSKFPDRASFDRALLEVLQGYAPELIVLAGFMRILTPDFIGAYAGRILNIHPSLLPKYRGLHTHRRVLEAGDAEHGVSVHFVTEELDGGPVILQSRIPVTPADTEDSLSARVQQCEHRIYPRVLEWYAQGRLAFRDHHAWLDGKRLDEPLDPATK
ncbi:phosphoribosylglycinamide formyltransferase [Steroidobacter denitrificans]|uniref:phosphoribosylglycinamide formyltransferase n=1 Tax=Steroidobacter denitrificans TaxID=465721 RepID=UPI0012ED0D28